MSTEQQAVDPQVAETQAGGAQAGAQASRFSQPTLDLVEHAFRELEYSERFVGHKMSSSVGNTPTYLYSLRDAVVFLVGTKWDRINPDTHKATLNWVNVDWLVSWMRDTVGDVELAKAIAEDVLPLESYKEQSDRMAELLAERMEQYRTVFEASAPEAEGEAAPASHTAQSTDAAPAYDGAQASPAASAGEAATN